MYYMLNVRLDPETESRLNALSKKTGRPKSYYVREAMAEHLDDMEDRYLAEQILSEAGECDYITQAEMEKAFGVDFSNEQKIR